MTATETDALVVGAGPSGLALALQAHDHGARVRVVERRAGASRPSRALIVHPRTLEVLRPLGVTDSLLERGHASPSVRLHLRRRQIPVTLGEFAIDDTAFPFLLFVVQTAVEEVLGDGLATRGLQVEYGTELRAVRIDAGRAVAQLCRRGQVETVSCRYVAGCDGSTSTVRRAAGIGWPGGPYHQEAVLADVELDGDLTPGEAHAVAGRNGVLFVFDVGERATWRLLATRPAPLSGQPPGQPPGQPAGAVAGQQLQRLLDDAGLGARITEVAWSARVSLDHRLAARYRTGPLFLVGDAAHLHSPAGGQGMNTGIQDATNLGWKLAFAATAAGGAGSGDRLLDSYEIERRAAARRVMAFTHAIFWAEASTDPVATFVRSRVVPLAGPILPLVLGRRRLVAAGVRWLSQLNVRYPGGAVCTEEGRPPRSGLRAGMRVPDQPVDIGSRRHRLHAVLARPGVHVLLQQSAPAIDPTPPDGRLHVWRIRNWPGTGAIAVRPDGYVGCRDGSGDLHQIGNWVAMAARAPAVTGRGPAGSGQ